MDQNNLIDLIAEKKRFRCYKVISRGRFSATVDFDYQDKMKKQSVLTLMKEESDARKFDFEKIQNPYTVQAIQYEYMYGLQTHLIYLEIAECTLQNKVGDKDFQKSPLAIESIFNWIKEVTMGLKKLHHNDYVHLKVQSSCIMITSKNRAKIGVLDFARHTSTLNRG